MKCVNAEIALVKAPPLRVFVRVQGVSGAGLVDIFPPATCSARFISVFRLEGAEKTRPRGTRALG